ncbi:unnamed protein product [Rotaria magnacalcarata]|uniref:C-type lectin domain-containing protein n=2 Tax=Rotaria magnacalcarata TaxID=392030 RepID=A0A816ZV87_9BILA|nr:unnamed protein product [Rotaria magnacalcarata]
MSTNLRLLTILALLILINGQRNDDRDLPPVSYVAGRNTKAVFDSQFSRGRCPERFYEIGDECLYFSIDGKIFQWQQAQHICERRVGPILEQPSNNPSQPNMKPTRGIRQLVLNTPEKTEILRAFFREYDEQNWAVRLPFDYNTLQRCQDGKDDKWPQFCENRPPSNSSCFETITTGQDDICLQEVICNKRYLRLACEFTLPGSAEITNSKFRHCSKTGDRSRRRLPVWLWIVIGVSSGLILLLIVLAVALRIMKSRKKPGKPQKTLPVPRRSDDTTVRPVIKRQDPAAEPMLVRTGPVNAGDSDYLQPQPSIKENKANA